MAKKKVVVKRVGRLDFDSVGVLNIYDTRGVAIDNKGNEILEAAKRAGYQAGDRFRYTITIQPKR